MKRIKGFIIREYLKSRAEGVFKYASNAEINQFELLNSLIQKASETEIGKKYHFSSIRNYDQFQNQVPIHEYNDLKPYFEKILKGEQRILWPTNIQWFSKSSGTTSDKSKYIPVSKEALAINHYLGAYDVMGMYAYNRPTTKIFEGKTLILGGSQQLHAPGSKIRSGDISAIMIYNQPLLADILRTPARDVTLMDDFEKKLELTSKISLRERVTGLAGVPTWNIVLMQMMLEKTGTKNIGEIWPDLELYLHGGVSFTPYSDTFKKLIPNQEMQYLQIYNASEGFFAFQDRLGAEDMLLATNHGIFYEFIPIAELECEQPKVLSLGEIEVGKQYAIVITTNSGLWRYKIGDTITFTSIIPFRIKVTGRTKSFINAFGEELIVENTDKALSMACKSTGSSVKDYTVAPIYFSEHQKACHEWMIEFDVIPEDISEFSRLLDQYLQQLNSDYEAKRSKDIALTQLKINIARKQLFYDWLKLNHKIGSQIKIPRLNNDRDFMEALLKMNR